MGEIADWHIEQILDADIESYYDNSYHGRDLRRLTKHFKKNEWVNKKGDVIAITAMGDKHLVHCINMIKKADYPSRAAFGFGAKWLPKLKKELKERKE